MDAADVDHADAGLSAAPTLSSSVRRWLGESGLIDANLGARVGVVLVEAARSRPKSGRVEVCLLHVVLVGLVHSLW
jgi:hypothetical protein